MWKQAKDMEAPGWIGRPKWLMVSDTKGIQASLRGPMKFNDVLSNNLGDNISAQDEVRRQQKGETWLERQRQRRE